MTLTVTHAFVSPIADQGDPTLLSPDKWNADHVITGSIGAAAPVHAVQFNNPLGTFAGDADFTWVSGLGLTIGGVAGVASGETYNITSTNTSFITPSFAGTGGNLFQGHSAFGNYADVDTTIINPGDPVNQTAPFTNLQAFCVTDYVSGDLSGIETDVANFIIGFRHTGAGTGSNFGIISGPTIASNSTGFWSSHYGLYFGPTNYGSGGIGSFVGIVGVPVHGGSGHVNGIIGIEAGFFNSGAVDQGWGILLDGPSGGGAIGDNYGIQVIAGSAGIATNNYGIRIEDQSAVGSSISENIHSAGATSLTKFEGHHYQGNYYETTEVTAPSAPPANGVRIYAQDNGGGKTQLMALFSSGAAQQIAIQP